MTPVRSMPGRLLVGFAGLLAGLVIPPAVAAQVPLDMAPMPMPAAVDRLRAEADDAERVGQWDRAIDLYLKLIAQDRLQPDLRERLHSCVRHSLRARRHRDASYEKVFAVNFTESLNLYAEVLKKLQANYIDRAQSSPANLFHAGLQEVALTLNDEAFRRRHLANATAEALQDFRHKLLTTWAERPVRNRDDAKRVVREVAVAAQRMLNVENPVVIVMEFTSGACNSLDEYSAYLTPAQWSDEVESPAAFLETLGIAVAVKGDHLVIDRVQPNGLAAQALVKKGDRIVRVNRKAVERPTPELFAELLRNPAGPFVELEVVSATGSAAQTLRVPLQLATVVGADLIKEGIGYLRVSGFQESTPQELDDAVLSLRARGMRVLVLDLRGNPGGLFLPAVRVAERFLSGGVIVSTQSPVDALNRSFTSASGMAALDVPLVLLVDGETASAAEVVAGAFKDHNRALLVGQPTFGKGTTQFVFRLADESDPSKPPRAGAFKVTRERLFSPSGQALSIFGVVPHLLEPMKDRQLDVATEQASRLLAMKP